MKRNRKTWSQARGTLSMLRHALARCSSNATRVPFLVTSLELRPELPGVPAPRDAGPWPTFRYRCATPSSSSTFSLSPTIDAFCLMAHYYTKNLRVMVCVLRIWRRSNVSLIKIGCTYWHSIHVYGKEWEWICGWRFKLKRSRYEWKILRNGICYSFRREE